jgi:hypothetical protein
MFRNILFLLIGLTLGVPAFAAEKPTTKPSSIIKQIYFNLGTHTEFYNAVQYDDSGGLRKFEFAPTVGIGLVMPLSGYWNMLPEFNWVLPKTYEDTKIIVNTFMYRFDIGYDPIEWLRLRVGTSIIQMNQQGRGGDTRENNGNGTSKFYYPSENRSSLNNTLDFGVEVMHEEFAFRLQTYTYSVFKKEQRQVSYSLLLTYYWDK